MYSKANPNQDLWGQSELTVKGGWSTVRHIQGRWPEVGFGTGFGDRHRATPQGSYQRGDQDRQGQKPHRDSSPRVGMLWPKPGGEGDMEGSATGRFPFYLKVFFSLPDLPLCSLNSLAQRVL